MNKDVHIKISKPQTQWFVLLVHKSRLSDFSFFFKNQVFPNLVIKARETVSRRSGKWQADTGNTTTYALKQKVSKISFWHYGNWKRLLRFMQQRTLFSLPHRNLRRKILASTAGPNWFRSFWSSSAAGNGSKPKNAHTPTQIEQNILMKEEVLCIVRHTFIL